MKLYLIRGLDANGDNQDLFVIADDPNEAVRIWNGYCLANDWIRVDDDTEADATRQVEPAHIREVLDDTMGTPYGGLARAVDWNEMKIVA